MAHPWHDVAIPAGADLAQGFPALVEIPMGSKNKYELDKTTGLLRLDRVLYSAVYYPANYGFIPRTYCADGDPLDVLVLGQEAIVPMCLVRARAIGAIRMSDEKGVDDKIVAVNVDDPEYEGYHELAQLPAHRERELRRFFLDYKVLEHKEVQLDQTLGRDDAVRLVVDAAALYTRHEAALRAGGRP